MLIPLTLIPAEGAPATPEKTEPKARGRDRLRYDPRAEIIRTVHLPLVVGLSVPTIWRLRRAGKFPQGIKLGENSVGFRRVDLEKWLTERSSAQRVEHVDLD